MKGRIYILLFATIVGFAAVILRLFQIQVLDRERYAQLGDEQSRTASRLERQRGTIYDRRGRELAVSLRVRSLAADPRKFQDESVRAQAAARLARYLPLPVDVIADRLGRRGEFSWIHRKLADDVADSIELLSIPGLFFQTEYRREYPHDTVAAHVLGFVGIDDEGLEGIEKSQNESLRGPDVEGQFVHDAYGNPVPVDGVIRYRKFDGRSVYLTIDLTIQSLLEQALYRQVQAYDARSASAVVMDPATGEILALANYPSFDPNEPGGSPAENRRNRALTDVFEPGSTFKIFSGALALGKGVVKTEDQFTCVGHLTVAGFPIRCHHAHGTVDYRRAIEASCNVAAMLVAQRLEPAALYEGLRAFGFGRKTGVDLPGEVTGVLRPVERWSKLSLSTIALGQEVSSTTLQLGSASCAMANGGRLMVPRIVQSVRDAQGRSIRSYPPEVRSTAIPPSVTRQMSDIMQGVVSRGTGTMAAVRPFTVAGKTGTGQVAGPRGGYIDGKYNSVFIGWVPAEAPVLAMAIVVHEPDPSLGYYGGQVAAPVFGWVGTEALRYLRVVGHETVDTRAVTRAADATAVPPRERGGAVRDGQVELPDLTGLTIREVHELMSSLPLDFRPTGSGVATSQSPAAGTRVPLDTLVRVEFTPPGGTDQFADDAGR